MTPRPDQDQNRKPSKQDMRTGGMVAVAALAVLAALTVLIVVMG